MTTSSSSHSFVNLRWQVNETVRLSISHWECSGRTTYAVALLVKRGSRWVVDGETAAEFTASSKDEQDTAFRSTDYGAKLVAGVLGECPFRFFRDTAL